MNTILKIFDNIGFRFKLQNNQFHQDKKISTFHFLDKSHIGYSIPYIARLVDSGLWEAGVGVVEFDSNAIPNFPALKTCIFFTKPEFFIAV